MVRGDGSYEEILRGAFQSSAPTVLEGEGLAQAAAPSAWKTKVVGTFRGTGDAVRFEGKAQVADLGGRTVRQCQLELARQP